jgi:hypothetical protein
MTQSELRSEAWMGKKVSTILVRQSEVDPVGSEEHLGMGGNGVALEPPSGCLGADRSILLVG